MSLRVAFVAEGDAESWNSWSGCARSFVQALRRRGITVDVYNAELIGWRRLLVAGGTLSLSKARWRARHGVDAIAFRAKSQIATQALRRAQGSYDAIIQAGATFQIAPAIKGRALSVVYADSNIRLAEAGRPYSGVTALPRRSIEDVVQIEQSVYDSADQIWSWSEALRSSFIDSFGQAPSKVRTIFAGANAKFDANVVAGGRTDGPPRILFVGKDHRRKGSEVLLEAFSAVRDRIPDAELHFVGANPVQDPRDGVICHGIIDGGSESGRMKLTALYQGATVFCLPSRYEPFGVSFVEAMLMGLPCIGTRRWAMPEIIDDPETGWLVEDGDVGDLVRALLEALSDRETSALRGARGRDKALTAFTWDRVAERAEAELRSEMGKPSVLTSSAQASR